MTEAEMTLLAKNEELGWIRNNTIFLKQEQIKHKKITRENDIIQHKQTEEFINRVIDLKNKCESNKNTIVTITLERDYTVGLSGQLS